MNDLVPSNGGAVTVSDSAALAPTQNGAVSHAALADLPRDVVIADGDRDAAASFATAMKGVPREFVHKALGWYSKELARMDAARDRLDASDAREVRAAMRGEWGSMYVQNIRAIKETLANLPIGVQQAIENAEIDDGTLLLNTQAGLRWLLDLGRANLTGGGSVAAELAEIRGLMGKQGSRYWKGPDAERLQARYRQLIGGR